MLEPKELIEEAVQASIDAGLAVNGEHGVAAARHAARFMFNALQAAARPAVTDDVAKPFLDYVKLSGFERLPDDMPLTAGSRMAARQITVGDFRRLAAALSAHPCTTSPVVDHETANVSDKQNAVTDALRELRGHIADVAAAGMLIGSNQNETFQRLQDKCKTMLAIVDTTLGAAGEPVAWREITEDDQPPRDTEVLMGCWESWPRQQWVVEFGLYGSTRGRWIHGRMTHWLPASYLPAAPQGASHDE